MPYTITLSIAGPDNYTIDEFETTNTDHNLCITNMDPLGGMCLRLGASSGVDSRFQIEDSNGNILFKTHADSTTFTAGKICPIIEDTGYRGVTESLCVGHTISRSAPAVNVGIGVSIGMKVQDLSNGAVYGTILESIATDVGATTSAFDLIIKNRSGNNTDPTEAIRVKANGDLQVVGNINLSDSGRLNLGDLPDCYLRHNGSGSIHMVNSTGDIIFDNTSSGGDIYSRLGSNTSATNFEVRGDDNQFIFKVAGDHQVQISGAQINRKQSSTSLNIVNTSNNITYTDTQFMSGLIIRDCNGTSRTDTIPSGFDIVSALLFPGVGMTFDLLICNVSGTGEDITLNNGSRGFVIGDNIIKSGQNMKFTGMVTNIGSGTQTYNLAAHGSGGDSGGSGGSSVPLTMSTIPFPVHKDEIGLVDRKPLFCWLQTSGTGLKFNKGRIYITDHGDDVDLQLAIYKLTNSATFDKYSTYNNSTRIVMSNNITWTDNDGPHNNGEGFVNFTFTETTLDSTSHYFVGLFNNVDGGDEPKYLGYKDAGDPARSLDNMFFLGNSTQSTPGTTMQNSINTGAKGDPPYINLYYQ